MHWVLQENLFKENEWNTLVETLEKFEIPFSVHKVIPFIGELVPAPNIEDEHVICFGSYSMRHSARANNWVPGVFDLEPFNFEIQLEHWGNLMLNADAKVTAFKDVKFTDLAFIRPIEDSKVFAGAIFDQKEFEDWQHKVCILEEDFGNSLAKDTLVQTCAPKKIFKEYRFWIVDGKIVTKSLYKLGNKVIYSSEVDSDVDAFVIKCIDMWQPLRAFVFDVADTPDGFKIVEINTINAAGFYAGDVQKLVFALNNMENL